MYKANFLIFWVVPMKYCCVYKWALGRITNYENGLNDKLWILLWASGVASENVTDFGRVSTEKDLFLILLMNDTYLSYLRFYVN